MEATLELHWGNLMLIARWEIWYSFKMFGTIFVLFGVVGCVDNPEIAIAAVDVV